MSPDSVEACDLSALKITQVCVCVGYLALALYWYRTRGTEKH